MVYEADNMSIPLETRYLYYIEAKLPDDKTWQQFTGCTISTPRKPVDEFYTHCRIHFRKMPYLFRLAENIQKKRKRFATKKTFYYDLPIHTNL